MNQEQLEKVRSGKGFIAALDQSGGSTPKALRLYGIERGRLLRRRRDVRPASTRCARRIITSPSFNGDRVLGAILFEDDDGPRDRGHAARPTTCGT